MSEPDFLSRAHYDEDDGETDTGFVFLFKWIEDTWGETARDIANQFVAVYLLMIIGVLGLYIMMRSTSKLRELRKNVVRVLREQRERKFDLDDYRNMPGAGGYL